MRRRAADGAEFAELAACGRRGEADELALVLLAEGLDPEIRRVAGAFVVGVPVEQVPRARSVLDAVAGERSEAVGGPEPPPLPGVRSRMGLHAGLVLLAVFGATGPWREGAWPFARGAADSGRILAGELERCVTALTLHADLLHVLGNAAALAILGSALARLRGTGTALLLLVAAGGLGNLATALLHGPGHRSVGASTAVFASVGALGALAVGRRRRAGLGRRLALVPVAAGVAILAMLGMAPGTDLAAHALGFACGVGLGGLLAAGRRPVPHGLDALAGGLAVAVVMVAWAVALLRPGGA